MDTQAYERILAKIEPLLKERGFHRETVQELDCFLGKDRAFSVIYKEENHLFVLRTAELEEGEGIVWTELSSWLYDEHSVPSDADSIGADFEDSIKQQLGIRENLQRNNRVELPTRSKKNEGMDMEGFTGKFLSIYPQYKDAYRETVAQYGEFLYDHFFRLYGAKQLVEALESGNRKQCDKMFSFLNEGFMNGDSAVGAVVLYTILAGALLDHPELVEKANDCMEKYNYLKDGTETLLRLLSSPSKRKKYLA